VGDNSAKKILVERALGDSCLWTLLARLDSPYANVRLESLITLRYIFDFTHKTRSMDPILHSVTSDFQDSNRSWLLVLRFALGHFHALLMCLERSIDDPLATRLTIQNITFLMRTHKQCRLQYARSNMFKEWRENPKNPLYSLETVEGLLIVSKDDPNGDVFLPEIRQFVSYIGEQYWPLSEETYPRYVIERFQNIWRMKRSDRPAMPQFHDPGEQWFSDRESEHSDGEDGGEDYDYEGFEEIFTSVGNGNGNDEEDRQSIDFLDDEPDVVTPEDLMAYFNAAEEAGLRSQDRRRNARRELEEQANVNQV